MERLTRTDAVVTSALAWRAGSEKQILFAPMGEEEDGLIQSLRTRARKRQRGWVGDVHRRGIR